MAEAEQQLAEAEQQLAEGKQALEEGYAQLAAGGYQIREGREQLAEAQEQLEAGGNELAENRAKLEEGRQMLAENLDVLNASLRALDQYGDELERLREGIRILKEEPGVKERLPKNPGVMEVLDTAEGYFQDLLGQLEREESAARWITWIVLAAAVCALGAVILGLARKKSPLAAAVFGAGASVLSLASLIFWRSECAMLDGLLPLAALALLITAALYAEFLLRKSRTGVESVSVS